MSERMSCQVRRRGCGVVNEVGGEMPWGPRQWTSASKTPVSTVVPCFIWMKMR